MPTKPATFYCPVCAQEYASQQLAHACINTYGYPSQPKFKPKDKVNLAHNGKKITALVYKIGYAKPGMLSAKPHTLIYLLIVDQSNGLIVTTAGENQLSLL